MEKHFTFYQIKEIIKQNNGMIIDSNKGVDTKTKKEYKINIVNENDNVFELKVEAEKYVNSKLWGIDINSKNEYELPQIFAHFTSCDDLNNTLISLAVKKNKVNSNNNIHSEKLF